MAKAKTAKKPAGAAFGQPLDLAAAKKMARNAGWALSIAGIIFFLFGLVLFLNPGTTVTTAIFALGFVMLFVGLLKLYEGLFASKGTGHALLFTVLGIITAVFGLILIVMPVAVSAGTFLTITLLAILLAVLALIDGLWQIVQAFTAKRNKLVFLALGVIYLLLGAVMLLNPFAAALALVSLVGLFVMIYGALIIGLALFLGGLAAAE